MSRSGNTRYMIQSVYLKILVIGIIIGGLVVFVLTQRNTPFLPNIIGGIIFAAAFYVYIQFSTRRRITLFLQQENPQEFINWFGNANKRLPDGQYHQSYVAGTIQALYGNFTYTRNHIAERNWSVVAPIFKAEGLLLEAILDYLEQHDYARGYQKSQEATKLADIPGIFPGSASAKKAYEIYVCAGAVLTEDDIEMNTRKLEGLFASVDVFMKILAAWALSIAYKKQQREEDFERMYQYLQEKAPHCKALLHSIQGSV